MTNWTQHTIKTNGITIAYHRTGGDDKPKLVLAHGITDSGLCWIRTAQELEADFDIIMVDARGHGESDKPEESYSPEDHADDLAGLIEGLGLQMPYVMGHSMGAATTANLASRYPHLVGKVILEDPPVYAATTPEEREIRNERMAAWREHLAAGQQRDVSEIIAEGKAQSPTWHEDEFEPWALAKQQVSMNVFNFGSKPRMPWPESVAKIQSPALLITGDTERGALVSTADADAAIQANPQIQLATIADAGHNIRRENFAAFIESVRAFMT